MVDAWLQVHSFKSMLWSVEIDVLVLVAKVGDDEKVLFSIMTVIGIDLVAVHRVIVGIHQVVEPTFSNALLAIA